MAPSLSDGIVGSTCGTGGPIWTCPRSPSAFFPPGDDGPSPEYPWVCGALPAGCTKIWRRTNNSPGHYNNDRARAWENGDRVRATVAFLHGVVCPPCHAYARTARVVLCTAYGHVVVTVTERSRAGGGSDPREGRSPSRADPGVILTSAVGAPGPHPWPLLPEVEDGGCPKEAVWCAEHDLAAVIMFLSLRKAMPRISPGSLHICLPPPGLAFQSLTSGPKLFSKKT